MTSEIFSACDATCVFLPPLSQAIARAWRSGQSRPVVAYRLAVRGVGEEIRLRCAQAKRRLARLIFHSAAEHGRKFLLGINCFVT